MKYFGIAAISLILLLACRQGPQTVGAALTTVIIGIRR